MTQTAMTLANLTVGPNSPFPAVTVDAAKDAAYAAAGRCGLRTRLRPETAWKVADTNNYYDAGAAWNQWRCTGSGSSLPVIGGTPRSVDMTGGGKRGLHSVASLMDGYSGGNPDFCIIIPVWLSTPAGAVIETLAHMGDDSGLDDWLGWNSAGLMEMRLSNTTIGSYAETDYEEWHIFVWRFFNQDGRVKLLKDGLTEVINQPIGVRQVNGGYPVLGGYTANANTSPWKGEFGQADFINGYVSDADLVTMLTPLGTEYGVTLAT